MDEVRRHISQAIQIAQGEMSEKRQQEQERTGSEAVRYREFVRNGSARARFDFWNKEFEGLRAARRGVGSGAREGSSGRGSEDSEAADVEGEDVEGEDGDEEEGEERGVVVRELGVEEAAQWERAHRGKRRSAGAKLRAIGRVIAFVSKIGREELGRRMRPLE